MFMGLGMPIPDLSNKPGPGRPGWPSGDLEFKLEIQGPGTFNYNASRAAGSTSYSIKFGDGATLSNVGAGSITHTYGAGTFILEINSEDDSGPIDTFQVTGTQTNKNLLTKILNWGTTQWVNLNTAFKNCHGLTNIDKSDFYSSGSITLTSAFENCDNLTSVDFTGWKASGSVSGQNMFKDCTALDSFKLKGNIKFASNSLNNYWFRNAGASTGCLFDISNLSFTTSVGTQANVQGWFYDAQIKNGSKFDNWNFPAANWALNQFFYDAHVPDNDATISIQNWTLPNNSSTSVSQLFRNLQTDTGSGTNLTLNMSNWNFGNITGLVSFMQSAKMSSIIGLNTWTANNVQNINNFFATTNNLGIDPNDNFTTSFWNNSNISNFNFAFRSLGGSTTSATAGAFPALNGMTVASGANFQQAFENTRFNSDASFTGVTFPASTINFSLAFYTAEFFNSNSTIDFSNSNLKSFTYNTTFRRCKVDNIVFGSNVDFSAVASWLRMFKADTGDTSYPDQNVTFPTNISFAAATDTREFPNIPFTTCQADNLIRALYATKPTASSNATTFDLTTSAITASPSIVNGLKDKLVSPGGWNITVNSTDAALPFAYPAYALDPAVYPTGISPTTIPSGAVFSTTTSGVTVNDSTGAISYASNFRGGITVKCTYSNGCYNEVGFIVQVPFVMRTVIPGLVGSTTYLDMEVKPQMSNGECFVDWGDSNSQTLTGNTTHTYASAGTYDIKIFDSPSGSKFENFSGYFPAYAGINSATYGSTYDIDIIQWGEIQWKNPSISGQGWFALGSNQKSYIELAAASNDAPDLSQVTSLRKMFGTSGGGAGQSDIARFTDPNDSMRSWNTSTITDMSEMWKAKLTDSSLSLDLSQWNVSNVETFASMFDAGSGNQQSSIGDLDISGWNSQSATNMSRMFYRTSANSVTGLGDLNTSSVTTMSQMFNNASGGVVNQASETLATKMVNGVLRWDVNNVTSFSSMFFDTNALSDTTFPTNWNISSDASKTVSMSTMFGGTPSGLTGVTNLDAFATKTINETWYGGTSYTAWNMSRVSSLSQFAYASGGGPISRNYNIASWQISSALTNMYYVFGGKSGGSGSVWQQDVSHWDVSGLDDGPNKVSYWLSARNGQSPPNMATSIYDSILDVTNGWGSQTGTTGFPTNISWQNGTSKYSPGNPLAVQRGNVGNPAGIPSGQMFVYDANVVLKDLTNVGDIVQLMNGGSSYGEFAKITGYLATDDRVAFVDVLGGAGFPVNWPGITWQYQIYDSDAAKGRYALLEAGWNITDGGVDLPFESAEIEIEIAPGQETFRLGTWPMSTKIDWGDGNGFINNPATNQPYTSYINSFTYPTTGQTEIYRVKIRENDTETFNGFRFGQYGDKARVRKIIAWGSQVATSYSRAFQGTDLNKAGFTNTLPVDSNGKVTKPTWVSSVTNFERAFAQCNMPANADWSNWSTGVAATNLSSMFSGNANFTGTGLSNWDVSKVTNISSFVGGTAFNSDISGWDLSSCIYANGLFSGTPFNHSSIVNFNLHNITHIVSMFQDCTAFNQDVDTKVVGTGANAYLAWDTANVNDMHACFNGATSFNYSIGKWKIDLTSLTGLASFFKGVGSNVTGGYTHDLLTKDVTIGAGTPVAKTYVAWDVSSVNGFGSSNINYPTSMGMFQGGKFNGDITNWDMSGLGQIGNPQYGYAGEWSKMFRENSLFNQDISRKTITNVSGKGTYTAWGMSNWTGGQDSFYQASAFDQNIGNWALNTSDTSNRSMTQFFRMAGISSANYTDSFTGWANTAKTNNGFPKNKQFPFMSRYGMAPIPVFDTTRTNGITAFTVNTAGRARSYLTLDVTVSSGASSVNGVYFYDFANDKWVKETDSSATIEWNTEESTWDVSYEGVVQHNGTGGSQTAGPESSTSWSGGISVVDSSLGWSISDDTITT